MRIYPDPQKWADKINSVPMPLRAKALNELDAAYLARGFKARGNGKDANGNWIDVDIKPGTDLAKVYEFLQTTDAAAITLEPEDIERMWGKNPVSLGIRRHLEINGTKEFELLEPDQLADALTHARYRSYGSADPDETAMQFATDDLVAAGFLDERETAAVDAWLEPHPDPMGLKIGERGRYSGDDMGEFTPDFEVEEEWGNF
jgi:hypothetical protein